MKVKTFNNISVSFNNLTLNFLKTFLNAFVLLLQSFNDRINCTIEKLLQNIYLLWTVSEQESGNVQFHQHHPGIKLIRP